MATVLTSFPNDDSRYPWGKWLNGSIWKLTRGVDFECEPNSIRAQAIRIALRGGLKLKSSVAGNEVVLQASKSKK